MPVEVLGFDGVSDAGEFVQAVENDRRARQMAQERANRLKTEALARRQARKVSLDEVFARVQEGDIKELNIVLKADVAGSLEALQDEIAKAPAGTGRDQHHPLPDRWHQRVRRDAGLGLRRDHHRLQRTAAGRCRRRRRQRGRRRPHLLGHLQDHRGPAHAMEGLLERGRGRGDDRRAVVKQIFKASKVGAHRRLHRRPSGKVVRSASVRADPRWHGRSGHGKLESLRRFKDDVQEVEERPGVRRSSSRATPTSRRTTCSRLPDTTGRADSGVSMARLPHAADQRGASRGRGRRDLR